MWMVYTVVVIKRRYSYYVYMVFMPTYGITLLSLIGLFTPSTAAQERVERCSMGGNALLNMSFVLMMVIAIMLKSAGKLPALGN
jgi:nicotinic acetylcholine receptor